MERSQAPILQKSNSFSSSSSATIDDKLCLRNISLGSIQFKERLAQKNQNANNQMHDQIDEGGQEHPEHENEDQEEATPSLKETFVNLSDDIDQFLTLLLTLEEEREQKRIDNDDDGESTSNTLPEIPEPTIEKLVALLEKEIAMHESSEGKSDDGLSHPMILDAITRIFKLTEALSPFASDPKYLDSVNVTSAALHHAMCFLEDEFYSLLEESSRSNKGQGSSKTKHRPSFSHGSHNDRCLLSPVAEPNLVEDHHPSPEALVRLQAIANSMIYVGYDTECRRVFAVARHNTFKSLLSDFGFEKISIDDVHKMAWESLEGEITKWVKTYKQSITSSLFLERELCYSVFIGHKTIASNIFRNLSSNIVRNLLNFPEAVAMTKRSTEKLFKVLDMYEALKETIPKIDLLFPYEENKSDKAAEEEAETEKPNSSEAAAELKSEISGVKSRLGESAAAIFYELENSIKRDTGKNIVPGGAVHPLTRYVMNYLKYTCEYMKTLEQIFKDHNKSKDEGFEAQLTRVMDLLESNLESKAKLYKEIALSNVFLMNNGRYIVQKIKGSPEINKLLGNTWCRKRSSDLRNYHKNYQRETWSKVLACFKDEGLTVKGSVSKPVLKERFKSFNALFEEIHKVQSAWVVNDEQLQSELRVSVTSVVVPAYRSFLGRFQQVLDAGRLTEKYIKFAAEDLETAIDELFNGNPNTSIVRRRN